MSVELGWAEHDVWHLFRRGMHVLPTRDKRPSVKWRKGPVDYVMVKPAEREIRKWMSMRPKPQGWAVICGGPAALVCLDIEAAGWTDTGHRGERIREVAGEFPDTCKRDSPSGGLHCWVKITDAPAPTGSGGKLVVVDNGADADGKRDFTLLAERRGHGHYAVMLGHGRDSLDADFAPVSMSLADYTVLEERLREVSDVLPVVQVRKNREARAIGAREHHACRDWESDPPKDVPDVLAKCVVDGTLSWLHVLDEGWEEVGAVADGWSMWLRPDYGTASGHGSSAHGAELMGTSSLTLWSASVPWGEPGESYSPMEVLQLSGRLSDRSVSFPKAVDMVTTTAQMVAKRGDAALNGTPFEEWPLKVFSKIAAFVDAERDGRPELQIGNVADFQDHLVKLLGTGSMSGVFRRGDTMVHAPKIGEEGYIPSPVEANVIDSPAQIRPVTPDRLAFLIENNNWLYQRSPQKGGGFIDTHIQCPMAVTQRLTSSAALLPNLRVLRGVVHAPLLREDGTVLSTPGYDERSKLLYLPDVPTPEVPDFPTKKDLDDARGMVLALISDFPWNSPDDKANYIIALLLPMLRLVVPPPWPMWLINAHMMGSGKTLLSSLLRVTHSGTQRPAPPESEEEQRKMITTVLSGSTGTVVVFDNIMSVLRSAELAGLLTSKVRSDRRLGTNEDIVAVNDRLWVGTGNNIQTGGDMARRTIWASIDPDTPEPWERPVSGYAIPHLLDFMTQHLGRIRWSLLVLLRQWVVEGMQVETESRSDDYGRLTSVAAGLLDSLGSPGAFNSPSTHQIQAGGETEEWAEFYAAIFAASGGAPFTVKELVAWMEPPGPDWAGGGGTASVHDAIPSDLTGKNGEVSAKSLGRFLVNRDGRYFQEYVSRVVGARGGSKLFRITRSEMSKVS